MSSSNKTLKFIPRNKSKEINSEKVNKVMVKHKPKGISKPLNKTPAQDRLKRLQGSLKTAKISKPSIEESTNIKLKPQSDQSILQSFLNSEIVNTKRLESRENMCRSQNLSKPITQISEMKSALTLKYSRSNSETPNPANTRLTKLKNFLTFDFSKFKNKCKTNLSTKEYEVNNTTTMCNISEEESMDWDEIPENFDKAMKEIRIELNNKNISDYEYLDQCLVKLLTQSNNKNITFNEDNSYLVVDTNVFLNNLKFIDEIIGLPCGIGKLIIIIPYIVLQELDKLKQRQVEAVSTLSTRAIKYINLKLKECNDFIRGQSAIEAERILINIDSPDDHILNCCLQIKEKTSKIILLSNDINLLNKAICNDIAAGTKDDFKITTT